ncbi:peptidase domain-containing ABC transporter [Streptomyces sp. NBC_00249]|uniref:peptidase domain-containing ABC transporter n=1 Tax=Streptomyces sp. NBC_00249 TaxID=2975690 RepID=UPI0022587CD2|nr:peptidase domain-containing ABC transporter [Streptomyces sp. NBC_00249]MCX5195922.1 peptidase domain-containing ABC transporter [Streptomyces sp. NBC_00249]
MTETDDVTEAGQSKPSASAPEGRARFSRQAAEKRASVRRWGDALSLPGLREQRQRRSLRGLATAASNLLTARRGPKVPVFYQTESADCGPTCLAMVLAFLGIDVDIAAVRRQLVAGHGGVSARALLQTARHFGALGRGVRVGVAGLSRLRSGSILFWNFDHFVVLEQVTSTHVYIVDPAMGRRRLKLEEVADAFTGVALEFEAPLVDRAPVRRRGFGVAQSSWRYLNLFITRDRRWISLIVASFLLIVFNFATPFATSYVVAHTGGGSRPGQAIVILCCALVGCVSFALLQILRGLALVSLQSLADRRVTLGVFGHLLSLPYEYFTRRNPGDLGMRVRTSTAVRQVLTNAALSGMFDGALVLFYLIMLLVVDLQFALLSMGLALAMVLVLFFFWKKQRYLSAEELEHQSIAEGSLLELLDGLQTIKACGLEDTAHDRWSHSVVDEINHRGRSRRNQVIGSAMSATIQFFAPLAVLALGYYRIASGTESLSSVVGFTALAVGMFVPLANLVHSALQVAGLGATLSRLTDILGTEPEERPADATPLDDVSGPVEVRDVSFSYAGSKDPILREVDVRFEGGTFTAILGRSGSGKSTLASVIAGLQIPSSGSVHLAGVPMTELDRVSLRRSISYIAQDARLFAGSIRDNITYALPGAPLDEVIQAAKLACVHDDIMALPMRYQTQLGPGGLGMSGGQRQRIALARGLIRKPQLLVLDEATSALDSATEKAIFDGLAAFDHTLIVIAHRLSVLEAADQVVVVDSGRVVAQGEYEDLMANSPIMRTLATGHGELQA